MSFLQTLTHTTAMDADRQSIELVSGLKTTLHNTHKNRSINNDEHFFYDTLIDIASTYFTKSDFTKDIESEDLIVPLFREDETNKNRLLKSAYAGQPEDADTIEQGIPRTITPLTSGMHILLVTETWLPDVNGVSMSLYQLMNQLMKMGHTISLLRPKPKSKAVTVDLQQYANLADQLLTHDIQVKGWAIPRYPDLQFGAPEYTHIKKEIDRIQPDIVHIATEGPLGLTALLAAKRLKVPVTTGYHTQFHDFSRHFGVGIIARPMMSYFKWFHNASKATCVPSQKTEKDLDKLGFKRLMEVGRGVDLERFNPKHRSDALRQSWGAGSQHTVLLMVSRLSPEKSVDVVIQGFKALQAEQLHRALKLVIVGDGPDKERLQSLAEECGDDVIFTGAQSGEALSQHYASGDAFVFASQVETFGNVVTEALASGLAVFAFDDAAAGMLINETNGKLAPVGDIEGFVDMVSHLPKMSQLKKQGECGAECVAGFSWQRPAHQMLDMFQKALVS